MKKIAVVTDVKYDGPGMKKSIFDSDNTEVFITSMQIDTYDRETDSIVKYSPKVDKNQKFFIGSIVLYVPQTNTVELVEHLSMENINDINDLGELHFQEEKKLYDESIIRIFESDSPEERKQKLESSREAAKKIMRLHSIDDRLRLELNNPYLFEDTQVLKIR